MTTTSIDPWFFATFSDLPDLKGGVDAPILNECALNLDMFKLNS